MVGKRRPIVALLTDFGQKNWYAPSIKGVILSICPGANVVDLTHEVPHQDVVTGAYILDFAARYYPKGTVFLCVVDPGVGTDRDLLILKSRADHFFVGPDNGLLTLVGEREGIGKIVKIANERYTLRKVSRTFHGRDIMAPVAAYLANGEPLENFGPQMKRMDRLKLEEPYIKNGKINGRVIFVDDFGNIITNIEGSMLGKIGLTVGEMVLVKFESSKEVVPLCSTYAEVEAGKPLGLIGSTNLFELSVNHGDASRLYNASLGSKMTVEKS